MISCPVYGLIAPTQCESFRGSSARVPPVCRDCQREEILPVIIENAPETIIEKPQFSESK